MKYSVFHVEGGIGKNIVATNIVRNIKKLHPDRHLVVVTPYPEVFLHNPHVHRVYKIGMCPYFYEDYIKDKDTIVFKHEPYNSNEVITRKTNLAKAWCKSLALNYDANKPELHFNQIEQQNALLLAQNLSNNKPMVAVQINGGMGASPRHINFNWFRDLPPQYVQPIINKHKHEYTFVQIKSSNQLKLENCVQIDLTLREVLLLLSQCKTAITIDSVTQHVMAAFQKPALVCWVGNSPVVYGYSLHTNVMSNLKLNEENLESYLDPYPLQTQGHQCPQSYDANALFNPETLANEFEKIVKN
jgi:ADP-heptose:LPS heptosyltransferase